MSINWLEPWDEIPAEEQYGHEVKELAREICADHVLFGVQVAAIGTRIDCDDVVFRLEDGSGKFAIVHLTYASKQETDPRWPHTVVFDNLDAFLQEMKSDHDDYA